MSNKKVPPPEQGELPKWSVDPRAKGEEKNWPDEDALKGQKNRNDLWWLKVYGILVIIATVFFTLLFLLTLGIWALHQLTTINWLNAEQLSRIQSIIFSGSLGAIVSGVMQKQLSK